MTRDEVVERLKASRETFDSKVEAVPYEALCVPAPGSAHSVKDIVAHVAAYDELIVARLRASRDGETTAFDRDREGWEAFNRRTWGEAAEVPLDDVLHRAIDVFASMVHEVGRLSDDELNACAGSTASLDPAWLEGHAPWELIATDTYDHYPMHHGALESAAGLG